MAGVGIGGFDGFIGLGVLMDQAMHLGDICKNFRKKFRNFGNHMGMKVVLGIGGTICAVLAPYYWFTNLEMDGVLHYRYPETRVHITMTVSGIVAFVLHVVGHYMRKKPWLRDRMVLWWGNWIVNWVVALFTLVFAMYHTTDTHGIIAQGLLTGCIFTLLELWRPVFDYDLLQYFIRMPLVSTFVHYSEKFGPLHYVVIPSSIVITLWNAFYLNVFNEDYNAEATQTTDAQIGVAPQSDATETSVAPTGAVGGVADETDSNIDRVIEEFAGDYMTTLPQEE